MNLIGCGGWVSYYYFLIGSAITKLLKEDIFGFGKSFQILNDLIIAKHKFLILFISYFSEFFFGLIITLYLVLKENAHIRKKNKYEKMKDEVPSHIAEKKEKIQKSQKIIEHINNPTQEVELISKDKENANENELLSNEINISLIDYDKVNNISNKLDSISKKTNNKKIMNSQNSSQTIPKKVELIHNSAYDDVSFEVSISSIILSSFLLIINDVIIKWIFSRNEIFDYFFLNILIMTLIFKYHYKEQIYSHQNVGLCIILFISGALFVACLFEDVDLSNTNKTIWEAFDENHYMVFIFIIIYFASSACSCYGTIIQKRIMDYQFVSPYNMILYKGLLGMIVSFVLVIISTYIPCKKNHIVNLSFTNINKINNNNYLYYNNFTDSNNNDNYTSPPLFECVVNYNNNTYFDNVLSYLNNVKNLAIKKDKYLELFLSIPIYCVLHFITNILLIIVNKLLSPIHCLIVDSLYRLLHIPIQTLQNIPVSNNTEGFFYEFIIQPLSTKILRVLAHFISLIGYSIYLEIIEFKCCGLNKNIRKNIKKRAKSDGKAKEYLSNYTLSTSTLTNDIDEDEDKESNKTT